jgi:transcriptional regulator with XRE-family HTH domain
MYLSKNLRYLREKNGKISQQKLADDLKVTRSAVSSYEDGRAEPKLENLIQFAEYFRISVDLLINHDLVRVDETQLQNKRDVEKYVAGQNLRVLTVAVDKNDNEKIILVPQKAAAGYTTGYADKDYLSELPQYQLPFLPKGRTYRAFEITGDSMLPIQPESIVVCEYVDDWNDIKDGNVCIVVSKNEGIVLKKVFNKVKDRGSFVMKSMNIHYKPYEIDADEILEMWKFSAYISKSLPEENYTSVFDLKEALWRLEDEVRDIKTGIKKEKASA